MNTDLNTQVTGGSSGKYGTSNKHPCYINIDIYLGLGVTRENCEIMELQHKELAMQKLSLYTVLFNCKANSCSCDTERFGNSQEKEIRNFCWKRQHVKRKLLLATRASLDKELYMSENDKFEL